MKVEEQKKKKKVIEMRACEIDRVVLHIDQLYRFTVDPTCIHCLAYIYNKGAYSDESIKST